MTLIGTSSNSMPIATKMAMVEAEEDSTGTLMVKAIAFVRLIDRLGILSYCQNGSKWVDTYILKKFFWHFISDCHIRDKVGYKHGSQDVRERVDASDVDECSRRCQESNYCRSFSFR